MGKSLSECTWELASTLPTKLIDNFEKGIHTEVVDSTSQSAGQSLHTLTLSVASPTAPTSAKQQRTTNPVLPPTSTGYVSL